MKKLGKKGSDLFQFIPGGGSSVTNFLTQKVKHFSAMAFKLYPHSKLKEAVELTERMLRDPQIKDQLETDEMTKLGDVFVPLWEDRGYQPEDLLKALSQANQGEIVFLPDIGLVCLEPDGQGYTTLFSLDENGKYIANDADAFSIMYGFQYAHEILGRSQLAAVCLKAARSSKAIGIRNMFLGIAEAALTHEKIDGYTHINPFPMFVDQGKKD